MICLDDRICQHCWTPSLPWVGDLVTRVLVFCFWYSGYIQNDVFYTLTRVLQRWLQPVVQVDQLTEPRWQEWWQSSSRRTWLYCSTNWDCFEFQVPSRGFAIDQIPSRWAPGTHNWGPPQPSRSLAWVVTIARVEVDKCERAAGI